MLSYATRMFLMDLFSSPREKILRRVRVLYGKQADTVMQELDRYSGSVAADRDRVQRAIVKLSDGSFENLKRWVEVALYDYRSVLGPAEYPEESTTEEVQRFNAWKIDDATVRETSFTGLAEDVENEN